MKQLIDLNIRQLIVLNYLQSGPKKMTELAQKAQCSTAAMTGMKDKMVTLGLVCEAHSQKDRRINLISATQKGLDALETLNTEKL